MYYYVLSTTCYYVLRSTYYYVLRTTYNYVLRRTFYYVLRTTHYYVLLRSTYYYVLRTTCYYVQRTTYYYVLRTAYYYVLRTTYYYVLGTTYYYVLRTTSYYVLRTTYYYVVRSAYYELPRTTYYIPLRTAYYILRTTTYCAQRTTYYNELRTTSYYVLRTPTDSEREVFALPPRLGGLGLKNPITRALEEFSASVKVAGPLKSLIMEKTWEIPIETLEKQRDAKNEISRNRRRTEAEIASQLKSSLPSALQHSMTLAQEKGASSWLTALPISEFGFTLHKGAFRDALCLRYGWLPSRLPERFDCGRQFTVEHALSCPKGGFPSLRHNEIRDITAALSAEVCNSVTVEPHLQPLSGEYLSGASANSQDGASLDVAMNGLWGGRYEKTYLDIRVFNPFAPSNRHPNLSTCYRKHENEKKREYEQRILNVEHASFSPIVMSCTGGFGRIATNTYKCLASLLAEKRNQAYGPTMCWLRCRLSFSLLRSSIMALRGSRSASERAIHSPPPVDRAISESQLAI